MATKNEVAKTEQKVSISAYLSNDAVKQNISGIVGATQTPTFISSIVSAVQTNPALTKCSNKSILSAALLGESLKLTPSPQLGMYYLVPYGAEATFQLGYKGYIQLAVRSGQYKKITATEVKQGELKSYNPITEDFELEPILDIEQREKLPVIGYYAMFELANGFRKEIFWTKAEMENHAKKYSMSYRSDLKYKSAKSFWSMNFDAQAKKTMLRQLISKWGVLSVDMQRAFDSDMAAIDENGNAKYVDNVPDKVVVENPFETEEPTNDVVDVEVIE